LNNGVIHEIDSKNWNEFISRGVVLVDFYAEWCPPCLKVEQVLKKLAHEYENKVKICRFNVESDSEIPRKFYVQLLPTLFIFKDGELISGIEGSADVSSIKRLIESVIK